MPIGSQKNTPCKRIEPRLGEGVNLYGRDTLHYLTLFSKVKLLIGAKNSVSIF